MNRKWIVKLGEPIIALGLMSACGTPNDNNDNTTENTNYTPQKQAPNNEDLRYNEDNVNHTDMRNHNSRNAPSSHIINDGNQNPYINNNNDKGAGPENGTEATDHFDNNRNQ